jgi:hypothetical protein
MTRMELLLDGNAIPSYAWVKVIFTRHWILRLTSDRITAGIELRFGTGGTAPVLVDGLT